MIVWAGVVKRLWLGEEMYGVWRPRGRLGERLCKKIVNFCQACKL